MDWALIAAVTATIAATFKLMDYFVSDAENIAAKKYLFVWKKSLSTYTFSEIGHLAGVKISALFDAIYGKGHLSFRCLLFSSISSLLAIFVCYLIFQLYWGIGPEIEDVDVFNNWVVWIIANLLIDFVSLAETRIFIGYIKNKPASQLIILSIVDIVFSAAIYIILITFLYTKIFPIFISDWEFSEIGPAIQSEFYTLIQNPNPSIDLTDKDILETLENKDHPGKSYFVIFSWSTFFTSAILQIYIMVFLVLKLIGPIRERIVVFLQNLESSDRAVSSFGVFIAAISGVLLSIMKMVSA